jgi:hypothetical protein
MEQFDLTLKTRDLLLTQLTRATKEVLRGHLTEVGTDLLLAQGTLERLKAHLDRLEEDEESYDKLVTYQR